MKLGVNLSFAVKRWIEPQALAALIRDKLDVTYVQYTWDLTDPWWPAAVRDRLARAYAKAFREAGLVTESTFGGLASYTYNHFLAPSDDLRRCGHEHLKRAIDMTSEMEVPATGMPFGSYSSADAVNPARRAEILKEAEEMWIDLAGHAARRGLKMLYVEPVPLGTEFPSSAADGLKLMKDLDGKTDIPVRLLVDWGHALFEPLFGEDANMDHWAKTCGDYIAAYHIQQTDGQLDRHWSFAHDGVISVQQMEDFWKRWNLTDQTFFAEFVYPFEATDEDVLDDMVKAMSTLKTAEAA